LISTSSWPEMLPNMSRTEGTSYNGDDILMQVDKMQSCLEQ